MANEIATFEQISAFTTLDEMNKALASFETVDDIADYLNASALDARRQWVATCLLVHKVFGTDKVTRKQAKARVEALGSKLGYKKSSIYQFATVGGQLLTDTKVKSINDLPATMSEYIKGVKADRPLLLFSHIEQIKSIGAIKRDSIKYGVFSGVKVAADSTAKSEDARAVIFIMQAPKDLPQEITINYTATPAGKQKANYYIGEQVVNPTFIDF